MIWVNDLFLIAPKQGRADDKNYHKKFEKKTVIKYGP
jgi:hypothetical protein